MHTTHLKYNKFAWMFSIQGADLGYVWWVARVAPHTNAPRLRLSKGKSVELLTFRLVGLTIQDTPKEPLFATHEHTVLQRSFTNGEVAPFYDSVVVRMHRHVPLHHPRRAGSPLCLRVRLSCGLRNLIVSGSPCTVLPHAFVLPG